MVAIKPSEKTNYQSVVGILDVMTIEKIKNYKMVDPKKEEQALINELNKKVE